VDDRLTAIASGVLATAAMLSFLWTMDAATPYRLEAHLAIAGLFGAPPTVGLALFAAMGVVVWPLVFFAIGQELAPGSELSRGVVLSLILWIAFAVAFFPTFDLGESMVFVVISLLGHLVYGAVLGLSFDRLGGQHR
jgi:hypothetical protein